MEHREFAADIVIVGGGLGGVAAAWAALRQGRTVVLTEETDWLGGQMTSQAVPPDEHPWIEHFGCTRSYRTLRERIRQYYHRYYPLSEKARNAAYFNPGNGFVSAICHEPRVSLAVIEAILAPYRAGGSLRILLRHRPVSAEVEGERIRSVSLLSGDDETALTVSAPYFIDATEWGDLLPLARVEYVTGAESRDETGEPHAARTADPLNMQAVSWCFVVDHVEGEDHTIERPGNYHFWRDHYPTLKPDWGSKLLSWSATHPITLDPVVRTFDPVHPEPERGPMDLWTFRRIAARDNFMEGTYRSDIVLVNWPQIDYMLGPVTELEPAEAGRHLEGARELSLSMLYWMQTEAPRLDGGTGWPGLRLRGDLTGTSHGLARAPYIRESRRIRGEFTVLEQHVGTKARMEVTGLQREEVQAERFQDSVGVGAYRIDLHPSTGGDNYIDVSSLPFQIPLGALIPVRVENLLPGCKNLAVTHVTNGCYRLHPVEWNVGEAAGLLAAHCLDRGRRPREVRGRSEYLEEFQKLLVRHGVELSWPRLAPL
ncbi:MAG: FAD-dependent oxidoreductase [Armatimonadetes bacterium]|nr:FAD-dependent oxidoreductase [Armatimonadota bacterium]